MTPATKEVTRTTISAAAAKLATVVAIKDDAGAHGHVLVEDEHVVATDGRRMVVIAEPSADGLFSEDEVVAYVPQHQLKDASREADRIAVEPLRCTSVDELGKSLRFVPFEETGELAFPDWRNVLPKSESRRLVARLNPKLLGDICNALASVGCTHVALRAGKLDETVLLEAELANEQIVHVVIAPTVPGSPASEMLPEGEHDELKVALEAGGKRVETTSGAMARRARALHAEANEREKGKPKRSA